MLGNARAPQKIRHLAYGPADGESYRSHKLPEALSRDTTGSRRGSTTGRAGSRATRCQTVRAIRPVSGFSGTV